MELSQLPLVFSVSSSVSVDVTSAPTKQAKGDSGKEPKLQGDVMEKKTLGETRLSRGVSSPLTNSSSKTVHHLWVFLFGFLVLISNISSGHTKLPRAILSVSPHNWLTEGDPVTLICKVYGSSKGWTFSWFTAIDPLHYRNDYKRLSDSSRGSGGKYTVSSAALKHTGVYVCRAETGKPAYYTTYSNKLPLWVTAVSPPVSLIISPNRTQHFTSVSLSLSCEDQSHSTGWTVRRYIDRHWPEDCSSSSSSYWGSQTGSTCTISSTVTSDTGVYWCHSESGENYNPVNITVRSVVSPVHPVTVRVTVTLCSLNQQTSIHPERGESPKSWISVTESHSESQISVLKILSSALTACPYLLVTVVLIFKCWRMRDASIDEEESSI